MTLTRREFIKAGVASVHIEDALFPKRAHYHKYVVHGIPLDEYVEKIEYACKERDRSDPDFVVIARTDTCRALGLEEASMRLNKAADVGADDPAGGSVQSSHVERPYAGVRGCR